MGLEFFKFGLDRPAVSARILGFGSSSSSLEIGAGAPTGRPLNVLGADKSISGFVRNEEFEFVEYDDIDVPGLFGGTNFDKGASSSESFCESDSDPEDSDVSLPALRDSGLAIAFGVDKFVAL